MNWSLLASSYGAVFGNVQVLLMTFLGALGGVLLGAIPGMTATMGVALLIPFSFGMDLIPSIGLLLGIYCGGMYGGSISAILIHAPGTPPWRPRCWTATRCARRVRRAGRFPSPCSRPSSAASSAR